MKIIRDGDDIILEYKYKIITNRNKRKGGIYYFYSTHLSSEIVEYFNTTEYWIYRHDGKIYLTTEEPVDYVNKKLKPRSKYKDRNIRSIPVNAKFFQLFGDVTDKYMKFRLHMNKKDFVSDDILIEMEIE